MATPKPKLTIALAGPDGNVYAIIAKVVIALRDKKKGDELKKRAFSAHSYEEVKTICQEYADIKWKK